MRSFRTKRLLVPVAAAALLAAGCVADDLDPKAAEVPPGGTIEIFMSEFDYRPASLSFVAGSTVKVTLINDGSVTHEFMAGRVRAEGGGYDNDLLAVVLTGADGSGFSTAGVELGTDEHAADGMTDDHDAEPMADDHAADGMTDDHAADGMTDDHDAEPMADDHEAEPMADDHEAEPMADDHDAEPMADDHDADEMADDHDADGMTDEEMAAMDDGMTDEEMAAMGGGGHAGHSGSAVSVEPGGRVELELLIPADVSGNWGFGCFIKGHYEAGMHGTMTVLATST